MSRLLVVGLGNELRGDDAAGLLTARALRDLAPDRFEIEEQPGDVAALAESLGRHRAVVIVDAVAGDFPPGTVLELDAHRPESRTRFSSHGFGLPEALALARLLEPQEAPRLKVRLIGVVGAEFAIGSPPSAAVARAAVELARRLSAELREGAACA